eukprot:m.180906 g.180906  ORF g.180906 m.180906 type:complete len:435 (-) comp32040_c2_seq2:31-1335(-)
MFRVAVVFTLATTLALSHAQACEEDDFDGYCTDVATALTAGVTGTCDENVDFGAMQCLFCQCSCIPGACGSLKWTDGGGDPGDGGDPEDGPFGEADTDAPTGVGETRPPTADPYQDIGEPPLAPTPEPSPSPSPAPSTAAPSPAPTPFKEACNKKCGSVELGGGECAADDVDRCLSCNDNKVLAKGVHEGKEFGRCVLKLICVGTKVLSPYDMGNAGMECECDTKRCQYCTKTSEGEVCKKCRDGWYFQNGVCVKACDVEFASSGTQTVGRRCLDPFQCKRGVSNNKDQPFKCKCTSPSDLTKADKNCQDCNFEAGRHGEQCTRCTNSKFLNLETQTCVDNCDGLDGTISYQVGLHGSECKAPFTCVDKADSETGAKCKCHRSLGSCVACTWGFNGNKCTVCGSRTYLKDGVCVDDCGDMTKEGTGATGRECRP